MAVAFIRGEVVRDPFFRSGDNTTFAAVTVRETYKDRSGEDRIGGYHDLIAFGDDAKRLALYGVGDNVDVKASIRYRADNRYVSTQDSSKNPFMVQYVVMEFLQGGPGGNASNDDRLSLGGDDGNEPF